MRHEFSNGGKEANPSQATGLNKTRPNNRHGSIVLYFMLVMATIVTGSLATMSMLSNTETKSAGVAFDRSAAFYAAEAGIQQALWNVKYNSTNFTHWLDANNGKAQTLSNGCVYTINLTSNNNWPASPLTFQAVGQSADGNVISQASATITNSRSAGFAPGFAMSGSDRFSGTLNIIGSFESTGTFQSSGTISLTNAPGQGNASLEAMNSYTGSGSFITPGDLIFNGGISTSGTINLGGNLQSGGAFHPSGTTTVAGSVAATGAISASGTVTVGGNMQSGSTLTSSGTTLVSGDLLSTGAISTSGTVKVSGNVQSGGRISDSGTWMVDGTTQDYTDTPSPASPNLNFTTPTIDTASISARATKISHISNNTIDFSDSPIIEVTGNVNLSGTTTIIPPSDGSTGTLMVDGNLMVSGTFGSAGSPANLNLVANGNVITAGTQYLNGALCCNALTASGTMQINGCIVIQNGISGSGSITMNSYVTPPWYVDWQDAGAGVGGTNTIAISDFTGPTY